MPAQTTVRPRSTLSTCIAAFKGRGTRQAAPTPPIHQTPHQHHTKPCYVLKHIALLLLAATAAIAAPTPDADAANLDDRNRHDYAGTARILDNGVRCRLGPSTKRTAIRAFQYGNYVAAACYVGGETIDGNSRWLYATQYRCYFSARFASYPGITECLQV